MTKIKVATKHQFESQLLFAVLGSIWLSFVAFVGAVVDDISIQKWTSFISFLLFVGVVIWRMVKREKEFCCPDCRGQVEPCIETEGDNAPILRLCKSCDVMWHMGNTPDSD